jgi:hypothetical protein
MLVWRYGMVSKGEGHWGLDRDNVRESNISVHGKGDRDVSSVENIYTLP